jgi:hypothetical protein
MLLPHFFLKQQDARKFKTEDIPKLSFVGCGGPLE